MITPTRISLVSQTVAALLESMRMGRWQRMLPGERILSQELHVSRWTIRLALAQLGKEGFVAITHGRRCSILSKARKVRGAEAAPIRVVHLAPNPLSLSRAFSVLVVDEMRTLLHEHGMTLTVVHSARLFRAAPDMALQALVETHPQSAWILLLSTTAIQRWFHDRGLPAVVTGSVQPGVALPGVDVDFFAAGVHVGHTVLGAGHRRVALLTPTPATGGILATENGLVSALAHRKLDARALTVVRLKEGRSEICSAINRLLKERAPPTALIFARSHAALTALTHLCRLGVRVPEDIALVSMEWEPCLSDTVPDVACYRLPAEQYARRVVRMLLQRLENVGQAEFVLMQPEFVPGDSLGRLRVST